MTAGHSHVGEAEREALVLEVDPEDHVVLSEWCRYTKHEVIPKLSDVCEWRWVARQLERALARRYPPVG